MEIIFDLPLSEFGNELQTFKQKQRTKKSKGQIKSCLDSRITFFLTIILGVIAETCDILEQVSNLNLIFLHFKIILPLCLHVEICVLVKQAEVKACTI